MLFNSWAFLAFVVLVFTAYYSIPKLGLSSRSQVILLVGSSLFFYAYETPSLVLLLLLSLVVNSAISELIVRASKVHGPGARWMALGIAVNLLILAFFKYASLIAGLLIPDGVLESFKSDLANIPLPVGISFYTFHSVSLLVDLYAKGVVGIQSLEAIFARPKHRVEAFLRITLYISFFPQLVAGPIVKAHQFFDQIGLKFISDIQWNEVLRNLITGFFLKMVIADNLKDVTQLLTSDNLARLGRLDLIALLYGYSFQIFADFAGYSLIAIGLGQLFGYRLPTNFDFPYVSASMTEFWRRWHISLSSFLREYLYIPLGGNRKGAYRTYLHLFIVMLLGGLWHGAAWRYAWWGAAHGVFLALEKALSDDSKRRDVSRPFNRVVHLGKMLLTFHIVSFLWLLFLMPDTDHVVEYVHAVLTTPVLLTSFQHLYIVFVYSIPVLIYHLAAYLRERPLVVARPADDDVNPVRLFGPHNVRAMSLAVMLCFILLNSGTAGAFIYFQF